MPNFFEQYVSDPISQFSRGGRSALKAEAPDFPDIDIEGLLERQAELNRINTVTPFGSTTFSTNEAGETTQTSRMSDVLQGRFNQLDGADRTAEREEVEDALFARQRRLIDPVFEEREDALRTSLSNRGVPTHTEGASGDFGELTRLERGRERSLEEAAMGATLAAGGEMRSDRAQEFGEFMSLFSGTAPPGITPIDVTGPANLAQGGDMAQMQAQMAAQAANKQGASSIGSAAAAAYFSCSREWKDIHGDVDAARALEIIEALPVVEFRYKMGDPKPHVGTIAENFNEEVFGAPAQTIEAIDYMGVMHAALKALAARVAELEAAK